jgi:hypothetical protein
MGAYAKITLSVCPCLFACSVQPPPPPPAPPAVTSPPSFSVGGEEDCDSIEDMDEWYREYERLCLSVVSLPACIYLVQR